MARHLICLLSQQLVPTYQTVKHFQPDCVWRIASHDSVKLDRPLRDTILRHIPQAPRLPDAQTTIVDSHWVMPSYDTVARLIESSPQDDEWIVNCTGGTKMMAGGALAAALNARNLADRNVQIVYVDAQHEHAYFDACTGEKHALHGDLSVREYLGLFDVQIPERLQYDRIKWMQLAVSWCREGAQYLPFNMQETELSKVRQGGATLPLQWRPDFPANLRCTLQRNLDTPNVPSWQMRYCTGDFLEYFIFHAMEVYRLELGIDEVLRGVRDVRREVGEVDLYVSRGGQLLVVECKSGTQRAADIAGQLGNLQAKVRRIGAMRSRGLLVTSGANALDEDGNVSNYVKTLARRHGIGLLLWRDIRDLALSFYDPPAAVRKLSEWMDS